MGTIGNTAALGAFQNDIYPAGVDRKRSKFHEDGGMWKVADGQTIRAGSLVAQNASGEIVQAVSVGGLANVLGVALYNTVDVIYDSVMFREITFSAGATGTASLGATNVSLLGLWTTPDFTGTLAADTVDYTVDLATGIVTNIAAGVIADGGTMYASFRRELTATEAQFRGVDFHSNTNDGLTNSSNRRMAIASDWGIIFTTQWDRTQSYAINSKLYCATASPGEGLFTSDSTDAEFVGHVMQLPSASDPFMGVRLAGAGQA